MAQFILSTVESARLDECEAIINKGLRTFVEVGNALLEIRDARLYREEFTTFEDYCRERWQLERAHAYRLIGAAQVVENLSPRGDIQPTSEKQIRPLASLPPDQQREAWVAATAVSPKPTAAEVGQAAKMVQAAIKRSPRVSQEELDRIEEQQLEKQRRQTTTLLFTQAVSLFDPRVMTVQKLTDHLFEYIDTKETTEVLTKARLERALETFANIVKQWKD